MGDVVKERNPFILDCGNAFIKALNGSKEIVFPHAIRELSNADWDHETRTNNQGNKPHEDYIKIDGVPYVIGQRAEKHGAITRRYGAARYNELYYGTLAVAAMARLYKRSMSNIFFFGSHAPADVDYRDDMMSAVCQKWQVEYRGESYIFDVEDGNTYDEPLGGIMNVMLSQKGTSFVRPELKHGTTLVLDIGGYTTDGLVVDPDGSIDYSATGSDKDMGILSVYDQFKKDFLHKYPKSFKSSKGLVEEEVRKALIVGQYNGRGLGMFDCKREADQAINMLVNRIRDIYEHYGGSAQYDHIVLTGGGSAVLESQLRDVLNHNSIYLADEAKDLHLANVRGGMKWYRLHKQLGTFDE